MTGEWQPFAEWCVLDCLWPEDRGTQERLEFLKARGCRILTADAFGISSALARVECFHATRRGSQQFELAELRA